MNAAQVFVAGRGAVPIREVAAWAGRSKRYVYVAVGRGELQKFGPGKVTADSLIRWYETKDQGRTTR